MSAKWTTRNTKTTVDGADKVLVLDSTETTPTALNNKLMEVTTLNSFQSLLNTVVVRSNADLPDRFLNTFDSTASNGAGGTTFTNAAGHGLLDGQTIQISLSSPQTSNDGFHVIKRIDSQDFDVVGLAFVDDSSGQFERCLAKDTAYQIAAPITTTLGYKLVDGSAMEIESTNRGANTITFNQAGGTFLTGRKIKNVRINKTRIIPTNQFAGGTEKFLDISGTNDPVNEIMLFFDSEANNFFDLGTVSHCGFGMQIPIVAFFRTGFLMTNVIMTTNGVGMLPALTSPFMTIKNFGDKPFPALVTIPHLTPVLFQGTVGYDLNLATPLVNRFAITDAAASLGGKLFKPNVPPPTGLITVFTGTATVSPTTITSTAHGLTTGQKIEIRGTTSYNTGLFNFLTSTVSASSFAITEITTDTFSIPIAFVANDATGKWNLVTTIASISGTPGTTPVTINTSEAHSLTNGDIVEISGTINYNGRFTVSGASGTVFTIPRVVVTESFAGKISPVKRVRQITAYVTVPVLAGLPTVYSANDIGGVTVTTSGVTTEFTDGRRVSIQGTTDGVYEGTFRILNVVVGTSFDIITPFVGDPTIPGIIELQLTDITVTNHRLPVSGADGLSVLITESDNYADGCIATQIPVTADPNKLRIDLAFVTGTATETGVLLDGSLDGTAKNVLINTVSGEINSKAKGSLSMNGNTTLTPTTTANAYVDIVLNNGTTPAVIQNNDTELFFLTDGTKGEFQYRGIEPFSGQLSATLAVTGSNGQTYTIRALKNDGVMVDESEYAVKLGNVDASFTFVASISAVANDKFKLQAKSDGNGALTISSFTQVIQ